MYAPGDVRVEDRDDPTIVEPTDAIIRLTATCICGSDLWPYRGAEKLDAPPRWATSTSASSSEIGAQVKNVKVGDFVVGSFFASDNTCEICQAGYQSRCVHADLMGAIGTQAEYARIPLADGTLVATPGHPDRDLIPSLLAASDVLGTGWFAAVAAEAGPGKTVAVVGDGAVGLSAVLAAQQLGAERIIAIQPPRRPPGPRPRVRRHRHRRGARRRRRREDQGAHRRLGAHGVIEAVGTRNRCGRPSAPPAPADTSATSASPTTSSSTGDELFFSGVHLDGGPAPVRRFLPELIQLIWDRKIDPGAVFDLTLPLDEAADGYQAMDERRATKVLLTF